MSDVGKMTDKKQKTKTKGQNCPFCLDKRKIRVTSRETSEVCWKHIIMNLPYNQDWTMEEIWHLKVYFDHLLQATAPRIAWGNETSRAHLFS